MAPARGEVRAALRCRHTSQLSVSLASVSLTVAAPASESVASVYRPQLCTPMLWSTAPLPLITARGSGERYTAPAGPCEDRPPNAFSCNPRPQICKCVTSFTHVRRTPIRWECCSKTSWCLIPRCPNFHCNGEIIKRHLSSLK